MKVFDAFTFFNELELLEVRLYELAPVVDGFILSESTHTHQGKPKTLYFNDNKDQFKKYNIEHIVSSPVHEGDLNELQVWDNEQYQRSVIEQALRGREGDIAMISDLDEIPSREVVENLRRLPCRVKQRMSYYYMNMLSGEDWWGTTIALVDDILRVGPQQLRNTRYDLSMPQIEGGWHFSYLGGPERIKYKIEAFAHSEYNEDEYKDLDRISQAIANGDDVYNRDLKYHKIPIDHTFPHLIREEPQRFDAFIAD